MKKTIFPLILLVLIFILTACNGTTAESAAENGNGAAVDAVNEDRQFSMPTEMKLMLGTVKLDETDVAVNADQASELLPLWKALRSLSESDTVAEAEIEALISQIEDTMSPDQINAIESMDLNMQDITGVMEMLGIQAGNFGGFGEISPEMQSTMEAMRESGEFQRPGGDFPGGGPGGGQGVGGGFGGFGGAEMDPNVRATAIAERGGTRRAGLGINSFLLDGIIEFLEAKIQ